MITQLFERHYVDHKTGEILSEERVEKRRIETETFGMHRTTEGLEWIFNFTGNEFQLMIVLLEMEDRTTGIVSLSPLKRKQLADIFGKSERYIRDIMKTILEKDGLLKLTTQDYLLNPNHFFKGGSTKLKAKRDYYAKMKAGLTGTDEITPNKEF